MRLLLLHTKPYAWQALTKDKAIFLNIDYNTLYGHIETLPKTKQGNQVVVVMADRYTTLKKAMPTTKTNATIVARIILESSVANYSISSRLRTDNGTQFLSKLFVVVCNTLGMNSITTAEYHTRTNGQVERF